MTRTKNKTLKAIFALALALVLCLGMGVTAFAAGAPITGDEANPAEAAITKMLEMPLGTDVPTGATFTFEIDAVDLDGEVSAVSTMPAIGPKTVTFDGTEGDASTATAKKVYQEVNVFSGVNWPHAGVYHYTIEETASITGYTLDSDTEELLYDTSFYDIFAYVDNGVSGLYIAAITSQTGTPGTSGTPAVPGEPGTEKVDPTPGTPEGPGTPGNIEGYSQMIFTNTYSKTSGPNPADSALTISKEVTGAFANQSFYFDYSLTVTQPAVITVPQTYKVYVMEGSTVVTDATLNGVTIAGTDPIYGDYFNAVSGTAVTVKMKHGQHLAFGGLHIGASYTVTEQAAADWTPSVVLTVNGGTPSTSSSGIGAELAVPSTLIGINTNTAAYSNKWKEVTPTGLDINDLPFIMMLVLAAAAVVTFVAVKYRKKARASNS